MAGEVLPLTEETGNVGDDNQGTKNAVQLRRKTSGARDELANNASALLEDPDSKGKRRRHNMLLGLTVAGVASSILTTVFGLFHVDFFLRVYGLPLSSYSTGNVLLSIVNTISGLVAAWVLDHASATTISRELMVGIAGGVFAICGFLTPFFRWETGTPWLEYWHFVISMILYDTCHSFCSILIGSIITDDHTMSDKERIQFMASGKLTNMVCSFFVAKIGLSLFDLEEEDSLRGFRTFVVILAILSCSLCFFGQSLISGMSFPFFRLLWGSSRRQSKSGDLERQQSRPKNPKLKWTRVLADFWKHKNFRSWVVMEMLLEAQVTFSAFFLKTFVDRLVFQHGYSRDTCDWLLSISRPLTQAFTIISYIPIRRYGYQPLYAALFVTNLCLSLFMLSFSNAENSPLLVIFFILTYPSITRAVQSSGFHLAMSDMVLEMKRKQALDGRIGEPSVAGLFMGMNALFCKPMESLFPVVAAGVMQENHSTDKSMFYILVLPALFCSCVQLAAWSHFNLTPARTAAMRRELLSLRNEYLRSSF